MADIEKLHAFHAISTYLTPEDRTLLLNKLGLPQENIDNRLSGLRCEDEFALILYFSENCNHILAFDEGISFLTKSFSPDLFIELKSGKKMFIEIKSVGIGNKLKISGGNLQNRIDFANNFNAELYFAIKINGSWGLFSSAYLQSKDGKIEFPAALNSSELTALLGLYYFAFKPGLKVVSRYSKTVSDGISEIGHEQFGKLVSYKMTFNHKVIIEAYPGNADEIIKSIWLEYLHDVMSVQSQNITQIDDDLTEIIEELIHPCLCNDYNFFISPIRHTIDSAGYLHNPTSFLKSILESRNDFPLKQPIRDVIMEFEKKWEAAAVPTKVVFNDDGTFGAECTVTDSSNP